jgi:hypothetical protein
LITITPDPSQKKETSSAAPASLKNHRKHRYSNSTGRSVDWEHIIRDEASSSIASGTVTGEEKVESGSGNSVRFGATIVGSPILSVAQSAYVSKAGDLPIPKSALKRRPAMKLDASMPDLVAQPHSAHSLDHDDAEHSDASESSIVIHPEDQILSDDEEYPPKLGLVTPSKSALHLDLSQVSSTSNTPFIDVPLSIEPKLRAHALKARVGVAHGPQLRAWRKVVGSSWTTPIMGDNSHAFVIATIEAMYFTGHTLGSQKLMGRYRGVPAPAPLLKPSTSPLKSSLPDNFDIADLDDEIDDDDDLEAEHQNLSMHSNPVIRSPRHPAGNMTTSASATSIQMTGGLDPLGSPVLSPRGSARSIAPAPSHQHTVSLNTTTSPRDESESLDSTKTPHMPHQQNALKSTHEVAKRPVPTTGLLSGLINKIRRTTPTLSPATTTTHAIPQNQNSTSSSPIAPGSHPHQSSPTSTSLMSSQESVMAQLRRKFRPWERLRRLRSSDPNIAPPDDLSAKSDFQNNHSHQLQNLSEAEEGSLRGSLSLPLSGVLRNSNGSDGSIPSGSRINREHIHHFPQPMRQRLPTTVESEVIRGPYFQRLQTHSKQTERIADNVKYLHDSAHEDLVGVTQSLERLTNGYAGIEIRFKKLSRQMEDTKHRAQSANALLLDNISKTSNAIQHLKFKRRTKPPMRLLLAALGWLVLLVGTLIWLFAAAFRAIVRTGHWIKSKFGGSPPPPSHNPPIRPSHPTRRQGSTASDSARMAMLKSGTGSNGSIGENGGGFDALESSGITHNGSFSMDSTSSPLSRASSKTVSLHSSFHDSLRQSHDSSSGSIASILTEDDDLWSDDEDGGGGGGGAKRLIGGISNPVQLEAQQLQTLEDMSKSIKALRMQEKAAKKKAAVERARASGR